MNVLLVAPQTSLPYAADEVAAVASALKAVPLLGHVTVRSVTTLISTRQWDVIWFATHGDRDGVLLSDGAKLSTSQITQATRNSGAGLLVLNSCDSVATANQVHEELGIDVVCTIVEVPDVEAFTTAAYFAQRLSEGKSVAEAYALAKPGQNRTYLLLQNGESMSPTHDATFAELLNQWGKQLSDQIARLDRRMDGMERRLDARLEHVEAQAAVNVAALQSIKPTRQRIVQWLLGFVIFVMGIAVLISDFRFQLGVSALAAYLAACVLLPMSAYLFVLGFGWEW